MRKQNTNLIAVYQLPFVVFVKAGEADSVAVGVGRDNKVGANLFSLLDG